MIDIENEHIYKTCVGRMLALLYLILQSRTAMVRLDY